MTLRSFENITGKGVRNGDIFGSWNLHSGDTAQPLICPRFNDKSIHIFGTWGGASVTLKATNDPALVSYDNAYDPEGMEISQNAAHNPWVIFPNVYAIKPVITGGDGTTNLTIAIIGRGGL